MNIDIVYLSDIEPAELKKYLLNNDLSNWLLNNLYREIDDLESIYPDFKSWYLTKVVRAIQNKSNEREIIIAFTEDNNSKYTIAGLVILKKDKDENKICTFRVREEFRGKLSIDGFTVAEKLFESSFEYLGDRKPMITISEKIYPMFEKYINKYQFERKQKLSDFYAKGSIEFIFNGLIKDQ